MVTYTFLKIYHLCIVLLFQVLHKAQEFLNYFTLTSAFIALLVESPVGDKVTQMSQFVSFFDDVMWMICLSGFLFLKTSSPVRPKWASKGNW